MARWYDALIIATFSMSDISRLSLSAASQSGFSALRTLSLTVIGWPSLVGHPEGDRGGSPLLIDRGTGRVSDLPFPEDAVRTVARTGVPG
jgi:hypothetical protein